MGRIDDLGSLFDSLVKRAPGGRRRSVKDVISSARERTNTARRRRGTSGRASDSVVTIEYKPVLDGDPDPGEVVWAWVPYEEDPTQGKDRPVVVIGRRGNTLVGIPLTSKRHDEEAQVEVGTGAWDSQRRTSYARIWRMLDLDPAAIRREGSILDRDRFEAVVAAVDDHYDVRRN